MTRRWTVALIWLALVLMPLRSVAHAVMLGSASIETVATSTGSAADAMPMPCQMVAGDGRSASTGCAMCDLCHSVAALVACASSLAEPLPLAPPRASPSLDAGRQQADGPFRPPRA